MAGSVQFGLSNVHYAVIGDEGAYETPVAIPGAVNLNLSADGDTNTFYADNGPYYATSSNAGYSGSLEVAQIPESFLIDVLGQVKDTNGIVYEATNAVPKQFALLFEVNGSENPTRFVYYACTATRPSANANTSTESTSPDTQTINISMVTKAFKIGGQNIDVTKGYMVKSAETLTKFNAWFEAVQAPGAGA